MRGFLCGLIFLVSVGALQSEVRVQAVADRTKVAVGDRIVVTVTVSGDKDFGSISLPPLPPNDLYSVVGTSRNPGRSTSVQIINGKMSKEVRSTYSYHLSADKTGSTTFPAIQLTIGGKTYTSEPFPITIVAGEISTPDVTVQLSASRTSLYPGEQCLITVRIAKRAQSEAQITFDGLKSFLEQLESRLSGNNAVYRLNKEDMRQLQGKAERREGEVWYVFTVRYAIFPHTPGSLSIPSLPFSYVVQERVRNSRGRDPFFGDFFNDPFFGMGSDVRTIQKTARSRPLTISVQTLPPAPPGFTGMVGTCELDGSLNQKQVAAGEAVTLTLRIRSNGLPRGLDGVSMPELDNIEVFTPEKNIRVDTTATGIHSSAVFRYLLVPQKEGATSIPPITWTYFDTDAQLYKTLSSGTLSLDVGKGKKMSSPARYMTQEEIRQVGSDIRYIKTDTTISHQTLYPYKRPIFYLVYTIPFLIVFFAFLLRYQSSRPKNEAAIARSRAYRTACRDLTVLLKHSATMTPQDILGRIASILERYISWKFGFAATGKTLTELKAELSHRSIDEQQIQKLSSFIEEIDRYRFGGTAAKDSPGSLMIGTTRSFIDELEKTARKKGRQ